MSILTNNTPLKIDVMYSSHHARRRYGALEKSTKPDGRSRDLSNSSFPIRFYLPRRAKTDLPHVELLILLHGLGEHDDTFYETLANNFAACGVPSLLFPLPNHLSRFPRQFYEQTDPMRALPGKEREIACVHRNGLIEKSYFFHRGFAEVIPELGDLLRIFDTARTDTTWPELAGYFSPDLEVSFVGYSLGGLVALAATLYLTRTPFEEDNDIVEPVSCINACIILSSGLSLNNIDVSRLFQYHEHSRFPPDHDTNARAKRIAEYVIHRIYGYHEMTEGGPKFFGRNSGAHILRTIFEMVVLGHHSPLYRRLLELNAHRLFFILGGNDEVFKADLIAGMRPLRGGLAHLEIPRLTHWFAAKGGESDDWKLWSRFLTTMILQFINSHPPIRFLETASLIELPQYDGSTAGLRFADIRDVLKKQSKLAETGCRKKCGEICVDDGYLTREKVHLALHAQSLLNSTRKSESS